MKKDITEIPGNIWLILNKHSMIVGKYKEEAFSQNVFVEIQDEKISSPIEQALLSAIKCVQVVNDIPNAHPEFDSNGESYLYGLKINPQFKLDRYRADFLIEWNTLKTRRAVIVECDSQQFHDRSEKERRYEKARDRFFALRGFTTFHYTGTEILQDPIKIASEILGYVTGLPADNYYESTKDYEV